MNSIAGIDTKELVSEYGTPLYVYDAQGFKNNYNKLKSAFDKYYPNNDIHFSVKANSNINVLKIFRELGSGADGSSPLEYELAKLAGFDTENILYTGNYEHPDDFKGPVNDGAMLNLDDMTSLNRALKVGKPERISFRINPGIGRGGFEGITTAGSDAKFGIPYEKASEAYRRAKDAGIERFGIHMMTGSNNLEPYYFAEVVDKLLMIARDVFEPLDIKPEYVDIGGGQGVPYYDHEPELNVDLMAKLISEVFTEKCDKYNFGRPTLVLEPGRYLAANAGYLIAKVTGIKEGYKKFIGLDAGMGTLVRPSLYGAYHRSSVYMKDENTQTVNLCGQICENSDIFAKDIPFPDVEEGDIVVFRECGAYGYVMASQYNNRLRPAEVLIENGRHRLIKRRENFDDVLRLYPEGSF
ncbi:MAG: diaminopimelate decarboxylase [Candidatus Kapaibacteriales bacterium]